MAKIVVTGSYITDIAAITSRFPRDGETVIGETVKIGPGGKGSNQATACKRLGAEVVLITKTGNDYLRNVALNHYKNENMSDKYVFVDEENQTGVAIIQIHKSSAENRILVTPGANNHITEEDVYKAENDFKTCDIVLLQLEASMESVIASIKLAKKYNKPVVLNPAPVKELDDDIFKLIDYFTPNETEAEFYSGLKADSIQNIEKMADLFIAKGVGNVIITLGKAERLLKQGMLLVLFLHIRLTQWTQPEREMRLMEDFVLLWQKARVLLKLQDLQMQLLPCRLQNLVHRNQCQTDWMLILF